jgi:hypothetical protein
MAMTVVAVEKSCGGGSAVEKSYGRRGFAGEKNCGDDGATRVGGGGAARIGGGDGGG